MKITKKIVTKIEGEATLKIYGDEIIDFVEVEFWQHNGIEEYLRNRHFMDALVINPRICGICGHSHLLATAKAIEAAFECEVSEKAQILRETTTFLEIVENHIKWFYITLFPTRIESREFIYKAFSFAKKISQAIALIAGQYPHNSYIIPGGVTCDITYVELGKLKNIIDEIYNDYTSLIINERLISPDLELFFNNMPKNIGKGLGEFLILGENSLFKKNGDYSFVSEENGKSFSKNALYKGKFVEVGPLGRMLSLKTPIQAVYEEFKDSIYTRILARIYEPLVLLNHLRKRLDRLDICEESYIQPCVKDSKGVAAIEAPRGSLIHQIEIKDEKISSYNIIVPTQFNLASSKSKQNPSAVQSSLMGEKREFMEPIFKCFDICAVCMSH